jgi:hypothetical protein
MNVTWKVEGASDWFKTITEDASCPPMEIATKVIECLTPSELSDNIGLLLMVTHDQMESIDQTYVCHTPTVLANAGFYKESKHLQDMIDMITKSSQDT